MRALEGGDRPRDERGDGGRKGPEPQAAVGGLADRLQLAAGRGELVEDADGVPVQRAARPRQAHAPGAALEQRCPGRALERGDLPGRSADWV